MNSVRELESYVCTLHDTRDQLKSHVFARSDAAFAEGDQARDRLLSPEVVRRRQSEIQQAFIRSIGGLPDAGSSLNASTTGVVRARGYVVEKVVFESSPDHYVTANLYLPDQREESSAAVLFLSGHELAAKHDPYYQRVILHFVQAGLIVLAVDPLGQGERLGFYDPAGADGPSMWGTQEHQQYGIQCHLLGDSVARYFVHDAMRAVDYLCERPEVDPARIGVTGNSGGGTQTAMMMICDERMAAAAPATFIMNRQTFMHAGGVQDAEQVWPGLSGLGYDHEDWLLAFAPKPLMVLATEYDFFPIEGTRRTVDRCKRFWEMLGRSEDIWLVTDASTHRYTDRLAEAAASFFVSQLKVKVTVGDVKLASIESQRLWCSPSGQVLRDQKGARSVLDLITDRCDQWATARARIPIESRRARMRQWMHEKVYAARKPCALNPRVIQHGDVGGLQVDYRLWWSQQGVMNSGYVFRPIAGDDDARLPLTVAVWRDGTRRLQEHWSWIRNTCESGRAVMVLNVSGVGPHEPHPIYGKPPHAYFGVMHKLADDLIWLGDSLAAMRTFDVLRCLEVIKWFDEWQHEDLRFYTAGREGLYVQFASTIDDSVRDLTAVQGVDRLADWATAKQFEEEGAMSVLLPGILQVLDLPELQELRTANLRQ